MPLLAQVSNLRYSNPDAARCVLAMRDQSTPVVALPLITVLAPEPESRLQRRRTIDAVITAATIGEAEVAHRAALDAAARLSLPEEMTVRLVRP